MQVIKHSDIIQFLQTEPIAMIGVSRNDRKFGNKAFKTLVQEGYNIIPIHSSIERIEGYQCFRSLSELDPPPKSFIICSKSDNLIPLLKEFKSIGGENVWFQQGCKFEEGANFCRENGVNYYYNNCILMASDAFPHKFHRFILKLFGRLK